MKKKGRHVRKGVEGQAAPQKGWSLKGTMKVGLPIDSGECRQMNKSVQS